MTYYFGLPNRVNDVYIQNPSKLPLLVFDFYSSLVGFVCIKQLICNNLMHINQYFVCSNVYLLTIVYYSSLYHKTPKLMKRCYLYILLSAMQILQRFIYYMIYFKKETVKEQGLQNVFPYDSPFSNHFLVSSGS